MLKSGRNLYVNTTFIVLLVVSGLFSYENSVHAPFVFDDLNIISKNNPHLRIDELSFESIGEVLAKSYGKYRPLSIISLAVNYYFWGRDTSGYHMVNIAIHLLAGIFLYFFLIITLKHSQTLIHTKSLPNRYFLSISSLNWIAFFSALIWLLHPLQTNAVTYIVQRMASLSAMFYVLSMLLYVKARISMRDGCTRLSIVLFTGCFLAGLCSVLSKENAATLPIVILIYEWFFFQDLRMIHPKYLLSGIVVSLFIFCTAVFIFLGGNPVDRILAEYHQLDFTLPERVMTEFRVIAYYFSIIFYSYPGRLMMDHDYPISQSFIDPSTTAISFLMVCMLFLTAIYSAKENRLLSFCILWFLGNLVIESSIIGIEIIYEHRLYLPSMMICFIIVCYTINRFRINLPVAAALISIAFVLGLWTHQRNQVWASDIHFWKDCALKSPHDARPLQNLAYSFYQKGQDEQAVRWYQQSLAIENHPITHFNIGLSLSRMGHHMEAIEAYKEAIELKYNPSKVYYNLARELLMTGEFSEAYENYRQAVKTNPKDKKAKRDLKKISRFLKACRSKDICLEKLCKEYPQNPSLRYKLGNLYEEIGEVGQAVKLYNQVLAMLPESNRQVYLSTLNHLAVCFLLTGEIDKAESVFLKGARLSPKNGQFQYQLAALNFYDGNTEEAFQWLEKAVENGFDELNRLETDTRFDDVRNENRFKRLKARIAAAAGNK